MLRELKAKIKKTGLGGMIILLVFVGLCNDVVTYPNKHASYDVPVWLIPILMRCYIFA